MEAVHVRFEETVPVLVIPDRAPFDELRTWIRAQLPERAHLLDGRTMRLDLGERDLKLFDLRRLVNLLREEFKAEVTGLYCRPDAIHRYAERELKLKLFPVGPQAPEPVETEPNSAEVEDGALAGLDDVLAALADDPTAEEEIELLEPEEAVRIEIPKPDLPPEEEEEARGDQTLHIRKTLRSGAAIDHLGDVMVYGDVNPGAEITASGNVVVLGKLKGVVHAGSRGAPDSFILAFELQPTQLRIGGRIAIVPRRGAGGFHPELARVVGDQILVEPYRGRLVRSSGA